MGHQTAEFMSTRDILAKIVRIAARLAETKEYEVDGSDLFDLTNEIRGRSLFASGPDNTLMGDTDFLIKDYFKAEYAIIGGMAMAIYGTPRLTEDIDALVSPFPDNPTMQDADEMRRHGFYKGKSSTGTVVQLVHTRGGGIELLAANTPLREYALRNAEVHKLLGHSVPVIPADAFVAMKINAYTNNRKREDKDVPDVVSVLKKTAPSMKEVRQFLDEEQNKELDKLLVGAGLPIDH